MTCADVTGPGFEKVTVAFHCLRPPGTAALANETAEMTGAPGVYTADLGADQSL